MTQDHQASRRAAARAAVRMVTRACACTVLLLLSSCVYFSSHTPRGACAQDLDSSIRNFCVVAPGVLWQGERPTVEDARWLIEHGVATIVSLQLDDSKTFRALTLPPELRHSVRYFRVRGFSPIQLFDRAHVDDRVALFLAIVRHAPKPIYVHCRAGVDRTMVLAAAYRMLIQGVSREQAIAQVARFHSPWILVERHYLRSLTGAHRAAVISQVEDWERRRPAGAELQCRQGRCRYVAATRR